MSKTYSTVIFDLGGVLIDWNPAYLYRKVFEKEEEVEYFLGNICTSRWHAMQDAGRPVKEATEVLLSQYPEWESQIRCFYERWAETMAGVIQGTEQILAELKAGGRHRLLALTNFSDELLPIAQDLYNFFQHFEGIVVSGTEKVVKPDPKIYQILLDRYGVDPATAIFIDDVEANIHAAEAAGITGVHFSNPEKLRKDLEKLSIL